MKRLKVPVLWVPFEGKSKVCDESEIPVYGGGIITHPVGFYSEVAVFWYLRRDGK